MPASAGTPKETAGEAPVASWLGRRSRAPLAEGAGVLISHPATDEWVRRVCAVYSDGRCLIAEGYEATAGCAQPSWSSAAPGELPGTGECPPA